IILSRPTPPHGCRVVLPICYNDIVQVGDTSTNYQIQAGDRVYVPTRSCWEEVFRNKPECPPCGGPHTPFDGGACRPGLTPAPPPPPGPPVQGPTPLPAPAPADEGKVSRGSAPAGWASGRGG